MKHFTKSITFLFASALFLMSSLAYGGGNKSKSNSSLFVKSIYSGGLTVTVSTTNITCNGLTNGIATANVSGGTPPYTYLWSTGATTSSISNLSVGSYTVYVNDANNDGGNVGTVTTLAGSATAGTTNGIGTSAKFGNPKGICTDGSGNLYIADAASNEIRKVVISTGVVTTFAGSITAGSSDGVGAAASFNNPTGVVYDGAGNLYVADKNNNEIRKISIATATVTTFSGSTTSGSTNGTGTAARFNKPHALVIDGSGNMYVSDFSNNEIRKIVLSTAAVTTFAGATASGSTNGTGTAARFYEPCGLTIDGSGNLYVADCLNDEIRKIVLSTAAVTTFAGTTAGGSTNGTGTAARFSAPACVTWDGGNNLYVADLNNNEIRSISIPTILVSTEAGTTTAGHANGSGSSASFDNPAAITIDGSGNLWVVELYDVREVVPTPPTIFGSASITQPGVLSVTASPTNVTCYGGTGSATANVNGGTSPFTYSWSPGGGNGATATNLSQGTYTVSVNDANLCGPVTQTVTITGPSAAMSLSSGGTTPVTCFGGSNGTATVNVSHSVGTVSYSWNSLPVQTTATASNLSAGNYTVTVTDACSTQTLGFTVGGPSSPLTLTSGGTTAVTCYGGNNGSATVNVSGNVGTTTYSWNSSPVQTTATASNLSAGNYTVTVTDACSSQILGFTITGPSSPLTLTSGGQTNVTCYGNNTGSATVNVSGNVGTTTYSWSPSGGNSATANNLSAGNYVVTVTDACSTQTLGFTITGPLSPLTLTSGGTTAVSCYGGSNGSATVNVSGNIGTTTYSWNSSPVQTTATASNLSAGNYTVTVTDACSTQTLGFTITQPSTLAIGTPIVTNVSCYGGNNGSASVGGSSTINYSYTGSVQNFTVPAGVTSITIALAGGSGGGNGGLGASFNATCSVNPGDVIGIAVAGAGQTNAFNAGGGGGATYIYDITQSTLLAVAGGGGGASTNGYAGGSAGTNLSGNGSGFGGGGEGNASNGVGGNGGNGGIGNNPAGGGAGWLSNGGNAVDGVGVAMGGLDRANGFFGGSGTDYVANSNGGFGGGGEGSESGGGGGGYNGGGAGNDFGWPANGGNGGTSYLSGTVIGSVTASNSGNGSASITYNSSVVSGGTSPYTYNWTNLSGSVSTSATATNLTAGTYTISVNDANNCGPVTTTVSITAPSVPMSLTSGGTTPTTCYGGTDGTATVNVSGNVGTTTYSWSNGSTTVSTSNPATGLTAGNYTVTVTDNCTSQSLAFNVGGPSAPMSISSGGTTPTTCYGGTDGTATVNVSNSIGTVSYSWSNGSTTVSTSNPATGLAAGNYTVTVTDNCSSQSLAFNVGGPSVPMSISSGGTTPTTCYGGTDGTATVEVINSIGTVSYSWSNGSTTVSTSNPATGLSAGSYTVTVTDNCSSQSLAFNVGGPSAPMSLSNGGQTNVNCYGNNTGSATVNVSGNVGTTTYSWSNGSTTVSTSNPATGLAAGNYTVTVTDACSSQTLGFTITGPSSPLTLTNGGTTPVTCYGGSDGTATANVSGGTPNYTYSWSNGTTNVSNTNPATGLSAGNYTVTVSDANSCGPVTTTVTITGPSSPLTLSNGGQTNVLCNGNNTGSATVNVSNSVGAVSYTWSPSGGNGATASNLSAGNYSVTVTDACSSQTLGFNITESSALTATISQSSPIYCVGGTTTLTANVSGGTGSYSYSWSTTETTSSITASVGTYNVTVTDANSCSTTTSITVSYAGSSLTVDQSCHDAVNGISNNPVETSGESFTAGVTGNMVALDVLVQSISAPETSTLNIYAGNGVGGPLILSQPVNFTTATGVIYITLTSPIPIIAGQQYTFNFVSGGQQIYFLGENPGTYFPRGMWFSNGSPQFGMDMYFDTYVNGGGPLTSATATETDVLCYGGNTGTATVTPVGGTAPYTYLWSDASSQTTATATGLTAGTYSVSVTDAHSCGPVYATVTVGGPSAAMSISSGGTTPTTCYGGTDGTATVNVSNNVGTPSYSWVNSSSTVVSTTDPATGLSAGNYTVTVTDNCSSQSLAFNVGGPSAAMSISSGGTTPTTCYGGTDGTATVNASNAVGTVGYVWTNASTIVSFSNPATGLSAGIYTVTVTDNCSSQSLAFNVGGPSVPMTISNGGTTPTTCYGGTDGMATVNVLNSVGTVSYSWSNGSTTVSTSNPATGLAAGNYTVTVTDNCSSQSLAFNVGGPSVPMTISNGGTTPTTCYGGTDGTATVNVSNNVGTPSYSWVNSSSTVVSTSDPATGLAAGNYTVTVTDNCSSQSLVFNVGGPSAAMSISNGGQTSVSCNSGNNGSATVTVSNSVGTVSYSWSNGSTTVSTSNPATGLTAGNYTVTVTDNCSTQTLSFNITQPAPIVFAGQETDVSCFGNNDGSISTNVQGGTAPYSYSWNGGPNGTNTSMSGLAPGTYSLQVTDGNSCTADTTFVVNQPALLTLTTSGRTDVTCYGASNGTASVTANGGTNHRSLGYTFSWNPNVSSTNNATGLSAGIYTVTVTDLHGCTAVDTILITQPNPLNVTLSGVNATCFGSNNGSETANVSGGTAPYTYLWSDGSSQTTATASGLSAGKYTVTVNDVHGCGSVTDTLTIEQPATLSVTTSSTPSSGSNGTATANVSGGTPAYTYLWSDASSQTTATATGLSAGTYSVTVNDANSCGPVVTTVNVGSAVLAISATGINATCYNDTTGTLVLNATGGNPPYQYYYQNTAIGSYNYITTSSSSITVPGLPAGTYQGAVIDNSSNSAFSSVVTIVVANAGDPTICYVSVDTAVTHNQLFWSLSGLNTTEIDSFLIYRDETTGYKQIGSVSPTSTSFVDNGSDPNIESSFYEIAIKDTCGQLSPMSPYHQTILLQASLGVGGVVNLTWNNYVGQPVQYYVILRDTGTGFLKYDSVPYGLLAYTDLKPPMTGKPLAYMLNSVWTGPLSCSPGVTTSHSNKKVIFVTGVNAISNPLTGVNVYPNPAKDVVTVTLPLSTEGVMTVTDVLGQPVYNEKLTGNETSKQIDLTNMTPGVYMIRIVSNGHEIVKRFIKM